MHTYIHACMHTCDMHTPPSPTRGLGDVLDKFGIKTSHQYIRIYTCTYIHVHIPHKQMDSDKLDEVGLKTSHPYMHIYTCKCIYAYTHTHSCTRQMDSDMLDEVGIKTRAARTKILDSARGLRALMDGPRCVCVCVCVNDMYLCIYIMTQVCVCVCV